jgi:hypothetical protein
MNLKKCNSDYYSRMFSKTAISFLLVLIAVVAYQCSAALKVPTAQDVADSGTSMDTLMKGRQLYIASCGSCHYLYLPEKYTAQQWIHNVEEMQKSAKINNEQKGIILKYLTSLSKDGARIEGKLKSDK